MRTREHVSPKDIVLGAVRRPGRRGVVFASVVAAGLHIGAGAIAFALGSTAEQRPVRESRPMVVVNHVVDLDPPAVEEPPPPPPPPPPVAKPSPRVKVKQPKAEPAPEVAAPTPAPEAAPPPEAPPSEPPPAAQAGQVVAAEKPAVSAPAFDIASGQGSAYAGGTTSGSGTGQSANHTGQVGKGTGNGYSHARPAQLRSRDWPCGWPPEAEDLDLEEAFVTVQASVKPDGSLADVKVLQDPGHGFGRRAVWCARSKVRFDPALDASGAPIAGVTPPLRIRFIREE